MQDVVSWQWVLWVPEVLNLSLVVEFPFLNIFLCVNPLRYPPESFNIYLGHVIQKYEENLLKWKNWEWKAGLMGQCFEDEFVLCRCKMHPQLPENFMKVLKDYYNMAMPIIYLAGVTCKYSMQFCSKRDKLRSVKAPPDTPNYSHTSHPFSVLLSISSWTFADWNLVWHFRDKWTKMHSRLSLSGDMHRQGKLWLWPCCGSLLEPP